MHASVTDLHVAYTIGLSLRDGSGGYELVTFEKMQDFRDEKKEEIVSDFPVVIHNIFVHVCVRCVCWSFLVFARTLVIACGRFEPVGCNQGHELVAF